MSHDVRFVAEASVELTDAAQWYEQRRAGLGLAFLAAVDLAVESLLRWPRAATPVAGLANEFEVRRVPIARFPYHLAYLVTKETLYVLAVAHDRRRPAYWSDRAVRG